MGGITLDFAVEVLVIKMGKLLTESMGVAVNEIWKVVRDMFNIVFIFMLIWIGIKTILYSDDSGVKRNLGYLLAAALLINFSLFITKSIVDFSNIAAYQIYNMITLKEGSVTGPDNYFWELDGNPLPNVERGPGTGRVNISEAFMQQLNIVSYAERGYLTNLAEDGETSTWRVAMFGLVMMTLMILAGFVFFAGAVLLIYRFVALVVLMIFSPAMFLGWIYPGFSNYGKKWWDHFISNAFVAPAYIFMLYATLILFKGVNPGGTFVKAFNGAESTTNATASLFLYFFLLCGFLIMATRVSQYMGAYGARSVAAIGSYGLGVLKGENFGPYRFLRRSGENAAGAAYRNLPVFGSKSYAKSIDKLDASRARASKGEATGWDKARIGWQGFRGAGSLEDRRQILEKGAGYAPFNTRTPAQLKQMEKDILDREAKLRRDDEQDKYVDKIDKFITENKDITNQAAVKEMVEAINNLNKDNIGNVKVDVLADERVAVHLTEKHIQKLKDSNRYSDADIRRINKAREKALIEVAEANTKWSGAKDGKGRDLPVSIVSRGKEDIEKLPDKVFTSPHMAPYLTPSFVKTKLEAGGMKKTVIKEMAEQIKEHAKKPGTDAYKKVWNKWINGNDITGVNFGANHPDMAASFKLK